MKKLKTYFFIVLAILFVVVFVQNAIFTGTTIFGSVEFKMLAWSSQVPIIVLLFIALFLGYFVGVLQMFFKNKYSNKAIEVAENSTKDNKENE